MSSGNTKTELMPTTIQSVTTVAGPGYPRPRRRVKEPIIDQILVSVYKGIGWAVGVLCTLLVAIGSALIFSTLGG